MKLSLIQRVIIGFTIVSLLMLAISGSAFLSQIRMAQQLELTASTLTNLLDKTSTVLLNLQNANRAMMQHANTTDEAQRTKLRTDYDTAKTAYEAVFTELSEDLIQFPEIAERVTEANTTAQSLLDKASSHMAIHDARIKARGQSFNELNNFDGEFIFFEQDFRDFIEDANFEGKQPVGWDLEFIIKEADGAQLYLQKSLAVTDDETIASYSSELEGYMGRINEKAENIKGAMDSISSDVEFYQNLLNRAVAEPDGLFQQHLTYVDLNKQSGELLSEIAAIMDNMTARLDDSASSIRSISASARTEAETSFRNSVTLNVILAAISLLVSVIIATTVVRAIKKPLTEIMAALKRLSSGDLTLTIKTKFHSEMGLVAKNINTLNDQLSQLISKIQQSAGTISTVAAESLSMSQQTNHDVAEQRTQTDSVATAVTEMEAAIQEVASHASDASDEVSKVTEQAQFNMDNMGKNLRFVHRLKESLDRASEVIQQLSDESQQIGDILNVIQGIAEQTNLLALNAAIEAARAGEQGRGFAVVADEVRSLANRTQQSANEIRDMIESLQGKASQAVSIVEGNLEHADRSVAQTTETNESLEEMVKSLTHVNDMSRSIATASEEQSAVAKEVAENIVNISDMSENIAGSAENAAKNSESLNELSNQQSELVSQFHLKDDA